MRGRRAVNRTVTAAFVVALSSLAGCTSLQSALTNHTTVSEVERRLDAALPIGSSRQEIEAWLTTQGIEHSYSDMPHAGSPVGNLAGDVHPLPTVVGIIRNTDRSLFVTGNIQLYFVLGTDGRLTQRLVKWIGTGL